MSYTEFRDNIRNAPDMKRHFFAAGIGAAGFTLSLITGLTPVFAIGATVLTMDISKRDENKPTNNGFERFASFELLDVFKNMGAHLGGALAVTLAVTPFVGTEQEPQTIEPQSQLIEQTDTQQASMQVPAATFKPA